MADKKETAAPSDEVTVEYLIDYGDKKKGDTGKLPVSEAWRLGWRNIVVQK